MGDLPQNERRNVIGRVYKPGTRLPDSQILWVVQLAKDNDVRAISESQGITVPGVQNILSTYHACTCLEDVMAEHPKRGGARAASVKQSESSCTTCATHAPHWSWQTTRGCCGSS